MQENYADKDNDMSFCLFGFVYTYTSRNYFDVFYFVMYIYIYIYIYIYMYTYIYIYMYTYIYICICTRSLGPPKEDHTNQAETYDVFEGPFVENDGLGKKMMSKCNSVYWVCFVIYSIVFNLSKRFSVNTCLYEQYKTSA